MHSLRAQCERKSHLEADNVELPLKEWELYQKLEGTRALFARSSESFPPGRRKREPLTAVGDSPVWRWLEREPRKS
jgi:hypothetical protein